MPDYGTQGERGMVVPRLAALQAEILPQKDDRAPQSTVTAAGSKIRP